MANKFTRNITNIEDIKKVPLETNNQNDLLSTKKDAYIRNDNDYYCLTDNVKSVNEEKPDENGNVTLPTVGLFEYKTVGFYNNIKDVTRPNLVGDIIIKYYENTSFYYLMIYVQMSQVRGENTDVEIVKHSEENWSFEGLEITDEEKEIFNIFEQEEKKQTIHSTDTTLTNILVDFGEITYGNLFVTMSNFTDETINLDIGYKFNKNILIPKRREA